MHDLDTTDWISNQHSILQGPQQQQLEEYVKGTTPSQPCPLLSVIVPSQAVMRLQGRKIHYKSKVEAAWRNADQENEADAQSNSKLAHARTVQLLSRR